VDGEKFSPRFPQSEPGFAQPVPKLITRVGDNAFTRMGEAGRDLRSYAQKLSPSIHRVWETGVQRPSDVRYVVFLSSLRFGASMGTLVD